MTREYDWEIHEMFKDQLESQLPAINQNITILKEGGDVSDIIDELFRYFHTYKSSSAYLGLTPLNELVSKTEIVLSSLREKKSPVGESVIEWLEEVQKQLLLYFDEMDENKTKLSALPDNLLNKLQITSLYMDPKKKLKSLSILYMDRNKQRAHKIVPFLEKLTKYVKHSTEEDSANTVFNLKPFDIIVVNLAKENHQAIDFIKANYPSLPIIVVFEKSSCVESTKLLKKGISHSLVSPLNAKVLHSELISVVKAYHSSSNIIIGHKKIEKFVETLEPLPNTIFEIIMICDEEESTVKELIKTVKKDPVLSANILKVANSPIYGSVNLKTIDQAVAKFGKRAIKALTMSGVYQSLGAIDLSAYNITEETFSTVSMTRLSLMLKWYSKVSIADLSLLSSTAILGNIGQLLISKELVNSKRNEQFEELCKVYSITYAEEFILNTTTAQVSSQILRYFKLEAAIIEIVENSDTPKDALPEFQKLCVANHVVNSLVDLKGNIADKISTRLLKLLDEFELDADVLTKALNSVKESS